MDGEPAQDEPQRVRILSTLESSRRTNKPKRNAKGRTASPWLHSLLWSVMGVGVLTLLIGFILVIQDSKPAPTKAALASAPRPQASPASSPLHALTQETLAPASAGPAVIETTVVAEAPTVVASAVATPLPTASAPVQPAPLESAKTTAPVKVAQAQTAKAKPTSKKKPDEDVALLEAMFEHTSGRATPESVRQEQKQRCGELSGAEAKACRAEVCRNRPSASICR